MSENQNDLAQQAEELQSKILAEGEGAPEGAQEKLDGSEQFGVIPCQEMEIPCTDPYWCPPSLATLQFTQDQESALEKVIRLSEGSREQVLERLWQRALARLIAAEAEQVLREADTE